MTGVSNVYRPVGYTCTMYCFIQMMYVLFADGHE